MFCTVNNLFSFYFAKDKFYLLFIVNRLILLNGFDPHPLHFVLEDGEHTLNRIEVWRVGRGEDILHAQLVKPIDDVVAVVHPQVVHHKTYVVHEVPGPELLQEHLELLLVHRFLEAHHLFNTPLLRYGSKDGYAGATKLLIVHLDLMLEPSPLFGRHSRLGHHCLVEVDNAEASADHWCQLLSHLFRLLLDAASKDWGQELGDLDLLAFDLVLGIEPRQCLGADLLAWVLEHEVQCPLL
jgi:hypothetical protein